MIAADELRAIPVLGGLEDADYAYLASIAEEREYAPGQALALQGDPAEAMAVILEGKIQYRQEGVPDLPIFIGVAGELTGLLPFSRMTHYPATVRALARTRTARIARTQLPEMLGRIPVLEGRLISALTDRVREATRAEQLHDKLMALGRLSAGLAHEMNNPAAALRRGTSHLRAQLRMLRDRTVSLAGRNLSVAEFSALAALQRRKMGAARATQLSPLEASEREEVVGTWLEDHGVPEAWALADTFVAAGVTGEEMEALASSLPERALPDALAWLGGGLEAELLLREMEDAATRITVLVASVKSYSHMDETSTRAETDLHEGVESTLAMLSFKIRERGARVERDYDFAMPPLWANAGELNQVWTNLLDNALDAITPGGRIGIRTVRRGDEAVIEIRDDGPGIPPAIAKRIWEPFFTTKDVGAGSGLGLDIVRRIVVRQHRGDIGVESRPGETCFRVHLPLRAPDPAPAVEEEVLNAAPLPGT
ncbi:MAG TPA: ATP-binding protein [Longimicrobium sp.]|jgi:signal transduction histidine kinase|nr:ATP-binding protein [Longimicrobium sp.]HLM68594.1 ATP-binding protein [Longimicrobium sp.]